MDGNKYQQKAMRTLNPKLTKEQVLINAAMGLCGESGEVIDYVKKWYAQGHPLDSEAIAKELGDVAWYLAEACTALDLQLDDVFQQNIDKLQKRFPSSFTSEDSMKRVDEK